VLDPFENRLFLANVTMPDRQLSFTLYARLLLAARLALTDRSKSSRSLSLAPLEREAPNCVNTDQRIGLLHRSGIMRGRRACQLLKALCEMRLVSKANIQRDLGNRLAKPETLTGS
jgi:hypothetical protein